MRHVRDCYAHVIIHNTTIPTILIVKLLTWLVLADVLSYFLDCIDLSLEICVNLSGGLSY